MPRRSTATLAGSDAACSGGNATLADIVRDPRRLNDADHAEVAALLTEVAAIETRLAARLAELAQDARREDRPPVEADMIADVREVARIVRHSVSWVRKSGHTLPGFRQPGG